VTKSQRLLFGGISWCRLRISSSSVEKRNRKGLSGLNLFSNNSASVNVAEVIARPRKSCRHNRVASRSSNINVSPWSSGFPAWKRLEPLQAPNVAYCNHMPPQYPRNARKMPQIMQFFGGATLGRSGQYANRRTSAVDPLPSRQAPMCRARGQSDTDRKVGNRMLLGCGGESDRGTKRTLAESSNRPQDGEYCYPKTDSSNARDAHRQLPSA